MFSCDHNLISTLYNGADVAGWMNNAITHECI